jgi:alpha-pyrone synthase
MTEACLNRIATAAPEHDVHDAFVAFADNMLRDAPDPRIRSLFQRMAQRSGIQHRYSVLSPNVSPNDDPEFTIDAHEFYRRGQFPSTSARMDAYEQQAPRLLNRTLDRLAISDDERSAITHVVVTSCTGLYAPGLDFAIIDHLGLDPSVERTMIGFMGCYAAINGLKTARHIVRSHPEAKVLCVNLELCTLHMQETVNLEQVLSFLVFADGCAAALVSADPVGLALDSFRSVVLPATRDLITWRIGGSGFDMVLDGKVPHAIGASLPHCAADILAGARPGDIAMWAVHPGGKSVLDAVQKGLALPQEALAASRCVLASFGNMSSATVMFVLQRIMDSIPANAGGKRGCAMSFGPGLTAETMLFHAL